jgi:hypothetical protein
VVNVETVVLPSFSLRVKGGPADSVTYVDLGNSWFATRQFIRVWYRTRVTP